MYAWTVTALVAKNAGWTATSCYENASSGCGVWLLKAVGQQL